MDAAQWQRELNSFGASSVTANLNQKVVKAGLLFSGFLAEHNLAFNQIWVGFRGLFWGGGGVDLKLLLELC